MGLVLGVKIAFENPFCCSANGTGVYFFKYAVFLKKKKKKELSVLVQ
jgi:hypothetical protein